MGAVDSALLLVKEFINLLRARVEATSEVELNKIEKDYRKAVDYAEHALLIAEHYTPSFTKKDRTRFNYLLKKYRKYN